MAHNLFLGMYTFSIKKKNVRKKAVLDNNEFLEFAYPKVKGNKFEKGFAQDIITLLDTKAYKNIENTHGAILEDYKIDHANRTLDIMIDGGLTGIKQFIIEEDGDKSELSHKDIIGPKFYARFWLPASTSTGYVFVQKYGGMSIKPIFDSILKDLLGTYDLSISLGKIKATTTKKRLKEFLQRSALKNITIVSTESNNSTGAAEASTVEIRLNNYRILKKTKDSTSIENIKAALSNHGFTIADRKYDLKGTYEYRHNGVKEERTIMLDATEETINVIPNIILPASCIDDDNYPIFKKLIELCDAEIIQVNSESKI